MTDPTTPRPLKVTTCYDPTGRTVSCYALVEDTDETRGEHRLWHKHEESVKNGMRSAIKERDDTIGDLRQEVAELKGDIKGIEIPEAVLGIEISRDGWTDDDPEDDEDQPAQDYIDDTPAAPVTSLYSPRTDLNDYDPRPIA